MEPEKAPEHFAQLWGKHRTSLTIMTSLQGAEEINICLNRPHDFQPKRKPFFCSLIRLCTAGRPWLMQHHHSRALCPLQMLPGLADSASCTCHGDTARGTRREKGGETPLRNGAAGCGRGQGSKAGSAFPKGRGGA